MQIFEENKGFEGIFFELKYMWFQTRLADLENTRPRWSASETPFKWCFAGGPMVARHCMLTG